MENKGVLIDHLNKNRFDSTMGALPTALPLAAKSEKGWQVVKSTDSKTALREPLALIKSAATDAKSKKIAEAVEKFVKSNAIEEIAKKWIEIP